MKCVLLCATLLATDVASAQLRNPTIIQQDTDIAIHSTDVYYRPMAAPADTDRREYLSCISHELRDPDGVRSYTYEPITHGVRLKDWDPYGTGPLGDTVVWMRLFTAKDKPSGAHSDIIAGGSDSDWVRVSKNEDVDFRASGTVRLEHGFHAMPGSFFHAYIEPRWDTLVFSDEFDDTAKFHNQWAVMDSAARAGNCSYSNNYALVSDPEARDGHALRLDFWFDTCSCRGYFGGGAAEDCTFSLTYDKASSKRYFSSANIKSCPWPFQSSGDTLRPAYAHAPYGKYEVRDKIPNIKHHTNTYTNDQSNEYNLYETYNGDMTVLHPGFSHNITYGPFKGTFSVRHGPPDTVVFRSAQAHFTTWNKPKTIIIDDFPYEVGLLDPSLRKDTVLIAGATTSHEGGFPAAIVADSTDSVTFYYVKDQWGTNLSDSLPWSVDPTGRYFTGGYGIAGNGDTLYFNRSYQPTSLAFLDSAYPCRWDHLSDRVYLETPLDPLAPHSGVDHLTYRTEEGPVYPVPGVNRDTAYTYHTYSMELLPHEGRILIDGYVVRRFPDRLVPIDDRRYDVVSDYSRTPLHIEPAEIDFDDDAVLAAEVASFNSYCTSLSHGGWDVNGHHAGHHLVDYVKVWDVPRDQKISEFPR